MAAPELVSPADWAEAGSTVIPAEAIITAPTTVQRTKA
jgi:hypothetical protein